MLSVNVCLDISPFFPTENHFSVYISADSLAFDLQYYQIKNWNEGYFLLYYPNSQKFSGISLFIVIQVQLQDDSLAVPFMFLLN